MIQARPPALQTNRPNHHRVAIEVSDRQTRAESCGRDEQPGIVLGMCGSVGGHLQAGRPQTVPTQLGHLS